VNSTERSVLALIAGGGVALLLYCALVMCALWVTGCAPLPARVEQPKHTPCVGDFHSYRLTPDGHKWYLDCVNQN
jgi:hypothetical protein